MAVSVLERPIGVILDDCVSATITEDYGGGANVNKTAHGLTNGSYVYIQSDIENYNGFWPILVVSANDFIPLQYPSGPYLTYIADATITYCPQISTHGWSCVHLPIVYTLSNNRYPINSVDTVRTITSISNDNGYVNLNLSGSLGSFEDLSFIKITNAPNSNLNGVIQILDKIATNDVTVNLAYSAVTNAGLVGASVQLYYGSYVIKCRVYGGLNSTHEWAGEKPYELLATLDLIPDSNNRVKFSVNEILKTQIRVENNLLGATLPVDIKSFTQFYIEYAESYDVSDGYTVQTLTSTYTSDQSTFEGVAVNSILEFKNQYSGYLTEYLMNRATAKFLTLFTIPVLFSCSDETPECYQDVSFLNPTDDIRLYVRQQYYSSGVLQSTVNTDLGVRDKGLIRASIADPDCTYDRVDMAIVAQEDYDNGDFEDQSLTGWTQEIGLNVQPSPETFWEIGSYLGNYGALYSFEILYGDPTPRTYHSKYLIHEYVQLQATAKTFSYSVRSGSRTTTAGTWGTASFRVGYYKDGSLVGTEVIIASLSPDTSYSGTFVTDVSDFDQVKFYFRAPTTPDAFPSDTFNGTWDFYVLQAEPSSLDTATLSETKQFEIECGCSNQELRLTWLNNLGGYDYWNFIAEKEYIRDITNSGETRANVFPSWPNSYGSFATTIRKQTFREANKKVLVRSQNVTLAQLQAIEFIKFSPVVQIINSRRDRRTVIVDTESFTSYADADNLYNISFTISYTDNIPSQKV